MARSREALFVAMSRNAGSVATFFRLPDNCRDRARDAGAALTGGVGRGSVKLAVARDPAAPGDSHAHLPGLAFDLGETIDMLRDTVQQFAAAEIAPRAADIDRDNLFPADLWKKLGALGLHGMTVKEEYGGSDLGYLAHIVAMEEVSRASASVGLSYGAHSNLAVNQLHRNGSDDAEAEVPAEAGRRASTSARWR